MRARNIKPGFFRNEELAECSALARLFFVGLWCAVDREGRCEYRAKRLRMDILPYEQSVDIDAICDELASHGFVEVYEVDGRKYIQVNNFEKHQRFHYSEKPNNFPPPPERSGKSSERSRSAPGALALNAECLMLNAECLNAETPLTPLPDSPPAESPPPESRPLARAGVSVPGQAGFTRFWKTYPPGIRKTGRKQCADFWRTNKLEPLADAVVAALEVFVASDQWGRDDGQYVPAPLVWLRKRAWETDLDELRAVVPAQGARPPNGAPHIDVKGAVERAFATPLPEPIHVRARRLAQEQRLAREQREC